MKKKSDKRKLLSISVDHEFEIIAHVSQGFMYGYFHRLLVLRAIVCLVERFKAKQNELKIFKFSANGQTSKSRKRLLNHPCPIQVDFDFSSFTSNNFRFASVLVILLH